MSIKKFVLAGAVTIALAAAGTASAQVAGSVNVSTTPNTAAVSPGTGVTIGTVTLSGVNGGGSVNSLPITITGSNGGQLSNLSNCQVYNANGTSLTNNNPVTIGSGANTFAFNTPMTVNNSTGNATLTVRCDVSSASPAGSVFTINAGAAAIGPVLRVNLDTAPSVPAGSQNVSLADISVGGTGANYNVTSIPLTITAGNGASTADLTGCVIRNTNDLNTAISATPVINNGSASAFVLNAPLSVLAGQAPMLALTCNVQPATPVGGTFTVSVTPSTVLATNAATGAAVTAVPVDAGTFGPNGLPGSTSGTILVSAAGSPIVLPAGMTTGSGSSASTGSTGTNVPGVPNTGVGTEFGAIMTLAIAGVVALVGSLYLRRKNV